MATREGKLRLIKDEDRCENFNCYQSFMSQTCGAAGPKPLQKRADIHHSPYRNAQYRNAQRLERELLHTDLHLDLPDGRTTVGPVGDCGTVGPHGQRGRQRRAMRPGGQQGFENEPHPKNPGPQTHRVLRVRTPAMEGPTPAMESPRILRAIKIHQRPSIKRNLVYPGPRRIRGAETAGAAETARLTSSEVGRELPRSLERRKTRRRGNERSGNVEAPWSHRGVIAELGHRSKDRR